MAKPVLAAFKDLGVSDNLCKILKTIGKSTTDCIWITTWLGAVVYVLFFDQFG